jgi:hypothetical protein
MRLDEQDIQAFIKIYEKELGEHLTIADARVMATKLINLIELIAKPLVENSDLEKPIINNSPNA